MQTDYEPIISVTDANDEVWFDIINRTITPQNEEAIVDVLVQNDSNSRNFGFHIQRYFEDEDLSTKNIRVHYINSLNQHDIASTHSIEVVGDSQDVVSFKWLISNKVCLESGNMRFCIEFYNDDETYRLFTKTIIINIIEGVDNGGYIPEPEVEWFTEYSSRMNNLETYIEDFKESAENGEFDGVGISTIKQTTISTEDSGINVITITKTDGETSTFNIKNGSKGLKGDKGDSGVYIGTGDMPEDCNLQIDPNGEVLVVEQSYNPQSTNPISAIGVAEALTKNSIVGTASGSNILLSNASNNKLAALKVYGKSTQNGTPTPEAPIDIVSMGDDGSVEVKLCGVNLYNDTKLVGVVYPQEIYIPANTPFTIGAYSTEGTSQFNVRFIYADGTENKDTVIINADVANGWVSKNYTYANPIKAIAFYNVTNTTARTIEKLIVRLGAYTITNLKYEPYTEQTLTLATPYSLKAIPITDKSLATYTDANGQMWRADEIDLEKGVYIQRVQEVSSFKLNRTENICDVYLTTIQVDTLGREVYPYALCTHMDNYGYNTNDSTHCYAHDKDIWVYIPKGTNVDNLKMFVLLKTPIEISLSAEEIAYYRTLHTNYPNTTIFNSEGANMEVSYVIDTKLYIDNKFAELQALVLDK